MVSTLSQGLRIIPSVGAGTPQPSSIELQGPLQGISTLGDLVNKIATFIMPLAAIILFFVLVWGGYDYLMSQGNAEKIKSAQAKITTGVIGFVLLVSSFLIVKLITSILGVGGGIL